ncbi:Nramp family divalent metal transporter [uncultured Eudoraea sp.]|uniref:Nramp family divalent metal transporter n=1 Tax=uncultured Eudoraea sp. TaxID=1035614 RepID=UPI002634C3B4|nr:Nramp family divalent metal transporter [uncultured Eudoraea sp.]
MFKKLGPGVLVAAAFIGPGTITACTIAGVGFGYALLWAMLLSIIATIILQEMSARVGVITQKGLAEVIGEQLAIPWLHYLVMGIILSAIVIGNTAYEAGNISGATLGLQVLFGSNYAALYPWIIGFIAFLLLYLGSYKTLEKVFISLVLIMSVSFVLTALFTKPDLMEILKGLFIPSIPDKSIFNIIALVGTTVVPYNLFLHASLIKEKWNSSDDLKSVRRDTLLSIGVGGLVSIAIIISAAAINSTEVKDALDLAKGLEPLYGKSAKYLMGIGLFAAGITSAITAPLAAAYVANSCFGWNTKVTDVRFRIVWMVVLFIGVISLSFGIRPIVIIQFAQVANGLLLPIIAIILIWIVNKSSVLGDFKNSIWQNVPAIIIIILVIVLGAKSIFSVFGII